MSDKHYESKKRWNAANYKQLNIAVRPELAEEFRLACGQAGIPMREVLTTFMAEYAKTPIAPKKKRERGYAERGSRRKAVAVMIKQLEMIHDAEEQYLSNIPENLVNSSRYEFAEHAVESLENAIDVLEGAFS